jgi:hypothetical protein
MYASVRRYDGVPREVALEVARRAHRECRHRLGQRAGFVAHEVVIGTDSFTSISVFENWVVAEETAKLAREWIAAHMGDLELPEPQVTAGEVYAEPGLPEPFARSARRQSWSVLDQTAEQRHV